MIRLIFNKPTEVMYYDSAEILKNNKILTSIVVFNCTLHFN